MRPPQPARAAHSRRRDHTQWAGVAGRTATAGLETASGIPTRQQEAQDTILGYLKKTLSALPAGTTLDATRYGGGTTTVGCDDNDNRPAAPKEFSTWGDITLPPGIDTATLVAQAGEIWKSWGWYVIERDGFYKPNRFGYAPDGYNLQIMARYRPDQPPGLSGVSPCFPGDVPEERSPFPRVLRAD